MKSRYVRDVSKNSAWHAVARPGSLKINFDLYFCGRL